MKSKMKLAKFFVGFFAVAAAMLTTSCLESDEYVSEPDTNATATSASATVSKEALANGGFIQTPQATESKVSASVQLSAADVAGLDDDAEVTLFVAEDETTGVVNVALQSSDGSTEALPGGGVTVNISGLEPNAVYTTQDGTTVQVDANGTAKVVVKNYGKPVVLTKVGAGHSGGAGGR